MTDRMELAELKTIIQAAGGQCWALGYAAALLEKISLLEAVGGFASLLAQLRSAKEPGDLRGRVLEVNFANLFVEKGIGLQYGAKQCTRGDVDFLWTFPGHEVFIEMKLLGQDKWAKDEINRKLEAAGKFEICNSDDTRDVARIQRDIFEKSSTKKFNPKPQPTWVNLVAVDVSELQLGAVDIGDCLLAAGGNEIASRYCHPACLRPAIVGIFEHEAVLTDEQHEWVKCNHKVLDADPHPRDYIHGVLFLFRSPKERAALSYQLSAAVIWNSALVDAQTGTEFCKSFHQIVPPSC